MSLGTHSSLFGTAWRMLIPPLRYGQTIVKFDPVAERKLRLKIDLYIIPTVALLYMFCFIDRANIGKAWMRQPVCAIRCMSNADGLI